MRAYLAYDEGGIDELGAIDKEQVVSLIEKADASLRTKKQFGVGFYRSEKDFLEIRPVGKSEYMIWSDIISGGGGSSGLLGFFSMRKTHIDKIVAGRETAAEAVFYYMDHSREAFERKYT
jgi:hypothetical protein